MVAQVVFLLSRAIFQETSTEMDVNENRRQAVSVFVKKKKNRHLFFVIYALIDYRNDIKMLKTLQDIAKSRPIQGAFFF